MSWIQFLDDLEEMIRSARSVPLSTSAVIPREDAISLIERIKANLPKETEQAKGVLAERDQVLAEARQEARDLVEAAREERTRLLANTDMVKAAKAEAARMLAGAEAETQEMRRQCDDYMDSKLAKFEIYLNRTLKTVSRGRDQLRQRLEDASEDVEPFNLEDSGEFSGPFSST